KDLVEELQGSTSKTTPRTTTPAPRWLAMLGEQANEVSYLLCDEGHTYNLLGEFLFLWLQSHREQLRKEQVHTENKGHDHDGRKFSEQILLLLEGRVNQLIAEAWRMQREAAEVWLKVLQGGPRSRPGSSATSPS
ncbi:unnamed protein product, partial [Amoebophrya sp. A120]